jgi:hypothetical protein
LASEVRLLFVVEGEHKKNHCEPNLFIQPIKKWVHLLVERAPSGFCSLAVSSFYTVFILSTFDALELYIDRK